VEMYLRFVERGLVNLLVKRFGDRFFLEHLVLAEQEPVFERELGEGEAEDELLPREERPVEPASQALCIVSGRSCAIERREELPGGRPES
jgi:hypothetical protein